MTTLGRRLAGQLGRLDMKRVDYLCRPALRPLVEREYTGHSVNHETDGDVLFLNGRTVLLGDAPADLVHLLEKAVAVQAHGELLGARVTGDRARRFAHALIEAVDAGRPAPFPPDHTVAAAPQGAQLVRYPWNLVSVNEAALRDDVQGIHAPAYQGQPLLGPGAKILKRDQVFLRDGVRLGAGSVLDATEGPIVLGDGVAVGHNAVLMGPVAVGPRSVIKAGARIEGPVSIGPVCKVGGEVEGSILQGHANKQHEGFLGHAYIGAWTNLGAGTNNSDLKNTYSTVRVWTPEGEVDTGERFVGLFMGDHTKTAIGTLFNTGTVVGFACNVFGAGFPPRHIPSFSWGGGGGLAVHALDKAMEAARAVMKRRNVDFEPADEVLFRSLFAAAQGP
jgi:UDP-N-acetylglucosamine diphosphorylase/glucosamine-1-phosphate N-acetyltransferase